jgi:hypothetical protein
MQIRLGRTVFLYEQTSRRDKKGDEQMMICTPVMYTMTDM